MIAMLVMLVIVEMIQYQYVLPFSTSSTSTYDDGLSGDDDG